MGKISQFEFLIMTEKNIFAYKFFLSLNISDFIFYVKIATPHERNHPSLSQQPPLKVKVLSSPPFWKFGWRLNTPLKKGGGAHYESMCPNMPFLIDDIEVI